VNAALLAAFLREAEAAGAKSLLAYLPARVNMPDAPEYDPALARVREFLDERELSYFDLTPTLLRLPYEERFVEGASHYSPRANALVARALSQVVGEILSGRRAQGTQEIPRGRGTTTARPGPRRRKPYSS
jgi:hypothetical protein